MSHRNEVGRNGAEPKGKGGTGLEAKIVILGAGPTGLGAAYRLQELGYRNWAIYERYGYVGGLATSFKDEAGYTYDIGGHVMFSHYKYFDNLVDKLLGDDYTEIQREAWVWMMDRFVPYPFQNNIGYLPREVALESILGLIEAHQNPEAVQRAANFYELIQAQFGKGIAKHFMEPYNFKVWAHPIEHMSRDWLGERVAMPDIERVLTNVLLDQPDKGWGPNNMFKYPLYGGTGGLYSPFVKYIKDNLHLNKSAVRVDPVGKQVHFEDGEVVDYDLLLSTMPIDLLVNRLIDGPEEVHRATRGLHHSSGFIVGVGVEKPIDSTKCWMYFPEPSAPFYRVTYLNNYSPYITPEPGHTLFLTETSYSPYKQESKATIIDRVVQGLIDTQLLGSGDLDKIRSTYLIDVDYSYPVPTLGRNSALHTVQRYLRDHDIYSRGRFGAWQYEIGNMDHSVMQGVEWVNSKLLGEKEVTWKDVRETQAAPAFLTHARPSLHAVSGHGSVNGTAMKVTLMNGKGVNGNGSNGTHAKTNGTGGTPAARRPRK